MKETTGMVAQVNQVQPDNWALPKSNDGAQLGMLCCALPLGIVLLYLIVREGVTRGMLTAWKKRDEQRLKQAVKAEKAAQAAAASKRESRGSSPPASGGSRSQGVA